MRERTRTKAFKIKIKNGRGHRRTDIFLLSTRIANSCFITYVSRMATKPMTISLPGELKAFIDARVRSGFYGNASDVIRAGLRALTREEMSASYREFQEIMATLPKDPLTPETEREIVAAIRKSRAAERSKARK